MRAIHLQSLSVGQDLREVRTDNAPDECPRCGGSFAATGGKPVTGPYQCQKCAADDWHAEINTKGSER